jgi:hypothetical protein
MPSGDAITIASAVFLAVGGFLFGYDSGIISSTIALEHFKFFFNNPSDDTVGGIVSSFQGGAVLGTMINMVSDAVTQCPWEDATDT